MSSIDKQTEIESNEEAKKHQPKMPWPVVATRTVHACPLCIRKLHNSYLPASASCPLDDGRSATYKASLLPVGCHA